MTETASTYLTRISRVSLASDMLSSTHFNHITRRFQRAKDAAFSTTIFPQVGSFDPGSQELYVSERKWIAEDHEKPDGPYIYEKLLHRLFWKVDRKRTVFVVGEIGVGKSTLVDFYLRSYCPSQKAKEWKEKLIVSVDLRNVPTIKEFDEQFYSQLRIAIVNRLKIKSSEFDITSDDAYAMWDIRFDWNSDHHRKQQATCAKSIMEYRGGLVNMTLATMNDKIWVQYALDYLSIMLSSDDPEQRARLPFSFLVLTLDNLDQSPLDVQSHAIASVRKWLVPQSRVKLWQVYIPLRPATFHVIADKCGPLPEFEVIHLGAPSLTKILETRANKARFVICEDGGTAKSELMSELDAPDLSKELANSKCEMFLAEVLSSTTKPFFIKLLNKLAAGSVRRLLWLWEVTLSSQSLQRSFEKTQFMGLPRLQYLHTYDLCDALLTGFYSVHHRIESPIANLFFAQKEEDCPYRSLLGVHIAHFAAAADFLEEDMTENQLLSQIRVFGYPSRHANVALQYLEQKKLFTPYIEGGERMFDVNQQIVEAHLELTQSPVYLDNMAMVTPIEKDLPGKICLTTSTNNKKFVARVESTLKFLRQLDKDEGDLLRAVSKREPNEVEEFLRVASDTHMPSCFRVCSDEFKARIQQLEEGPYLPNVTKAEWSQISKTDVFQKAARMPKLLAERFRDELY